MNIIKDLHQDNKDSFNYITGVAIAIVTNNTDPENQGRVRVKYPWLSDDNESDWVRISTFMAGKNFGSFFLPDVGNEVLVAFEHGDINSPYILGTLWNGEDIPPSNNKNGKNNIRQIRTRSGHSINFNDNSNDREEKITIESGSGHQIVVNDSEGNNGISLKTNSGQEILIDDENNLIQVQDKSGNYLKINSNGIEIASKGKISFSAQSKIDLSAANIQLGTNANLGLLNESFLSLFNSHTHIGNMGAPTAPPMIQGVKYVHSTKTVKGN